MMNLLRVCVYLTICNLTCTAQIQFTDTGQTLGDDYSLDVELGDIDGDGDLDAIVGNSSGISGTQTVRMWINDGSGMFTVGEQILTGYGVGLGDVDDDGDLDAFTLNGDAAQANELSPKDVYLMGSEQVPEQYPRCAEVLRSRNIPVAYPEGG